jgi:hypothetical protein
VRGAGRYNRAQMDVIAVASLLINDVITAVDVEGIAGYGFSPHHARGMRPRSFPTASAYALRVARS